MGTWTGLGGTKPQDKDQQRPESSKAGAASSTTTKPERQGLSRMGTWGFGGKSIEAQAAEHDDDDDDRRIRFTIGGAGRRLTKDDFLKEIQSLDPKARCEVVEESDAPAAMKAMAKKDASPDSPGTSRLFGAKDTQAATGKGEAKTVAAAMARKKGAQETYDQDSSSSEEVAREKRRKGVVELARAKKDAPAKPSATMLNTASGNEPESAAERKRREKALRGVDDVTDAQRGRSPPREEQPVQHQETAADRRRRLAMEGGSSGGGARAGGGSSRMLSPGIDGESAAERRRREAALGVGTEGQEDSDDDDTPRVPPPVARSRGIRFAQSPVRGKK